MSAQVTCALLKESPDVQPLRTLTYMFSGDSGFPGHLVDTHWTPRESLAQVWFNSIIAHPTVDGHAAGISMENVEIEKATPS